MSIETSHETTLDNDAAIAFSLLVSGTAALHVDPPVKTSRDSLEATRQYIARVAEQPDLKLVLNDEDNSLRIEPPVTDPEALYGVSQVILGSLGETAGRACHLAIYEPTE